MTAEALIEQNPDRLDLKYRNPLQAAFIQEYQERTGQALSEFEQIKLMFDMSPRVSDVIDDPKNKEIRDLAMQGEYKKAAKLLLAKLKI